MTPASVPINHEMALGVRFYKRKAPVSVFRGETPANRPAQNVRITLFRKIKCCKLFQTSSWSADMKAISCHVEPATHVKISKAASASGKSTADLVRQAIAYGWPSVEENLKPLIAARRQAGLR